LRDLEILLFIISLFWGKKATILICHLYLSNLSCTFLMMAIINFKLIFFDIF
jgi:hypothetical protein